MAAPIAGSHLQLKELFSFAETLRKMATSIASSHLQLKEQLSLAETMAILEALWVIFASYSKSVMPQSEF